MLRGWHVSYTLATRNPALLGEEAVREIQSLWIFGFAGFGGHRKRKHLALHVVKQEFHLSLPH